MNKQVAVIGVIAIVALAGGGALAYNNQQNKNDAEVMQMQKEESTDTMMKKTESTEVMSKDTDAKMAAPDAMEKTSDTMTKTEGDAMVKPDEDAMTR